MRKKRSLYDAYKFPGFTPKQQISGIFGDPNALAIKLNRRGKKLLVAPAVKFIELSMIVRSDKFVTFLAVTSVFISGWKFVASFVKNAKK